MQSNLSADRVASLIDDLLRQITDAFSKEDELNLVGVRTRGAILADRLVARLRALGYDKIDHGVIDITMYRDDIGARGPRPLVRTSQPLGNLVVYLLEPLSEDGLGTWNFFDAGLKAGEDFPVVRAMGVPE